MKKLSLLIALALIVTVGGVYATWNYAGLKMQDTTHEFKNLGITDKDINTQSGKIAVTDTLILKIDDEGDFTPGWDSDVNSTNSGEIQIVFTPNPGASTTTIKYVVSIANNTYTPQGTQSAVGIFKVNGDATAKTAKTAIFEGTFTYTAGQTEVCSETISLSTITSKLVPNDAIRLPTVEDYNVYANALKDVVLSIDITEVE